MTASTKERPILFSAPMVRALLDGRKTQTRRIVKPQPTQKVGGFGTMPGDWAFPCRNRFVFTVTNKPEAPDGWAAENCPYGVPGDRLWVREALWCDVDGKGWCYASDNASLQSEGNYDLAEAWMTQRHARQNHVPSIHMPRWASRITLELTDVRVQRVQDISAADCLAEGIEIPQMRKDDARLKIASDRAGGFDAGHCELCRVIYGELWDSINGRGSWAANPWVWALTFKQIRSDQ